MYWFFATVLFSFVAFFWDELILAGIAKIIGFDITPKFLFTWILISGLIVILLISFGVPSEHRFIVSCICTFIFVMSLLTRHGTLAPRRNNSLKR